MIALQREITQPVCSPLIRSVDGVNMIRNVQGYLHAVQDITIPGIYPIRSIISHHYCFLQCLDHKVEVLL